MVVAVVVYPLQLMVNVQIKLCSPVLYQVLSSRPTSQFKVRIRQLGMPTSFLRLRLFLRALLAPYCIRDLWYVMTYHASSPAWPCVQVPLPRHRRSVLRMLRSGSRCVPPLQPSAAPATGTRQPYHIVPWELQARQPYHTILCHGSYPGYRHAMR